MRYVVINRLKEGMILGKPFYGRFGEIMLQEGSKLTGRVLDKFRDLQYAGLYIRDEFSEGIEVEDIISDELRNNAMRALRSFMINIGDPKTDKNQIQKDMREISGSVNKIVDEISMSDHKLVNLIDLKVFDLYTYQHSVNVCVLACVVGVELGLTRDQLCNLTLAAMLHDVGKAFISQNILNKPGCLEPEEYEEIKKHPVLGYEYIKDNFFFDYTVNVSIMQHHERYDGRGYPSGQKGDSIVQFARIIAVADVFDAITSKRPYREAMLASEAYEYILGNSKQHFHPEIVDAFIKKVAPFPLGLTVKLSNGLEGIIFKNYTNYLTRPLVKIINSKEQSGGGHFLDLLNDPDARNVTVKEVIA